MRPKGQAVGHSRLPHQEYQKAALLYASGMSMRDVAIALNIDIKAVQNRLKKHGMPRRNRSEATKLAFARKKEKANV